MAFIDTQDSVQSPWLQYHLGHVTAYSSNSNKKKPTKTKETKVRTNVSTPVRPGLHKSVSNLEFGSSGAPVKSGSKQNVKFSYSVAPTKDKWCSGVRSDPPSPLNSSSVAITTPVGVTELPPDGVKGSGLPLIETNKSAESAAFRSRSAKQRLLGTTRQDFSVSFKNKSNRINDPSVPYSDPSFVNNLMFINVHREANPRFYSQYVGETRLNLNSSVDSSIKTLNSKLSLDSVSVEGPYNTPPGLRVSLSASNVKKRNPRIHAPRSAIERYLEHEDMITANDNSVLIHLPTAKQLVKPVSSKIEPINAKFEHVNLGEVINKQTFDGDGDNTKWPVITNYNGINDKDRLSNTNISNNKTGSSPIDGELSPNGSISPTRHSSNGVVSPNSSLSPTRGSSNGVLSPNNIILSPKSVQLPACPHGHFDHSMDSDCAAYTSPVNSEHCRTPKEHTIRKGILRDKNSDSSNHTKSGLPMINGHSVKTSKDAVDKVRSANLTMSDFHCIKIEETDANNNIPQSQRYSTVHSFYGTDGLLIETSINRLANNIRENRSRAAPAQNPREGVQQYRKERERRK